MTREEFEALVDIVAPLRRHAPDTDGKCRRCDDQALNQGDFWQFANADCHGTARAALLGAWDEQASALADCRRLIREGADVLTTHRLRADAAEARLAALAAPSPEPGPGDAHIGLGPAASLATAARSQGEKEGYRRGFREGVEAGARAVESSGEARLSVPMHARQIMARVIRALAAGSADTRERGAK